MILTTFFSTVKHAILTGAGELKATAPDGAGTHFIEGAKCPVDQTGKEMAIALEGLTPTGTIIRISRGQKVPAVEAVLQKDLPAIVSCGGDQPINTGQERAAARVRQVTPGRIVTSWFLENRALPTPSAGVDVAAHPKNAIRHLSNGKRAQTFNTHVLPTEHHGPPPKLSVLRRAGRCSLSSPKRNRILLPKLFLAAGLQTRGSVLPTPTWKETGFGRTELQQQKVIQPCFQSGNQENQIIIKA